MSYVSNVVLLTFIDDPGIKDLQLWLSENEMPALNQVDGFAGGKRAFEAEIWVGAYNYLDIQEFTQAVLDAKWLYPDAVQLLIKQEADDVFSLRAGSMPDAR